MINPVLTLRATEAAVVAAVEVRDVHRAIDEDILPGSLLRRAARERELTQWGCVFLSFYVEGAAVLTAQERRRIIGEAAEWKIVRLEPLREAIEGSVRLRRPADFRIRHNFLTVDLEPFIRNILIGLDRLRDAQAMVVRDPEILAGSTPVIRGTRIPVYDVAASLQTTSIADVAEAYPSLTLEQIELARLYAAADPPRGRPVRLDQRPPLSSHRVTRPRRG